MEYLSLTCRCAAVCFSRMCVKVVVVVVVGVEEEVARLGDVMSVRPLPTGQGRLFGYLGYTSGRPREETNNFEIGNQN